MKRSWNPGLWFGFVLLLLGMVSYPLFFARFPVTRDFPWANFLIILLALVLIGIGVARAFGRPDQYRGEISGSILAVLALGLTMFFCYGVFVVTKQLPASHAAPHIGDLAPDFTLADSKGNPMTLSALIDSPFSGNGLSPAATASGPTAATVLIFYRGYW